MRLGLYQNNKNKQYYWTVGIVTNTTNAQDRQQMVHYMNGAGEHMVREQTEFLEKFTPVLLPKST